MSKFGELINTEKPVLLSFFTEWNEESQSMQDILKNVAATLGDQAKVIKINVDKNVELSNALRIKTLPTFILYKSGEMMWRQSGIQDGNALVSLLQQYS